MPDDDAADNRPAEERGEIELARRLARELAEAELASSVSRAAEARLESLLARLAEEFRLLWERATGASRSVPAGADSSFGDRPDAGAFGPGQGAPGRGGFAPAPPTTAGPWQPSVSRPSARARLEEKIDRLSPAARTAFEDELLRLVTTDADVKAALDKSPQALPTVAKYAGNAQVRQLLREAPSPAGSPRRESARDDVTRAAVDELVVDEVVVDELAVDEAVVDEAVTAGLSWELFVDEVSRMPLSSPARSQPLSPGGTGIDDRAFGTAGTSGPVRHGHSDTDPAPPAAGPPNSTQPPPPASPAAPRLLGEPGQALLAEQVAASRPTAHRTGKAGESGPPGSPSVRPPTDGRQTPTR
ncbi:hypothetical protein [Streptomyces anandii]|uniref:hypothetical protein n=1 Tax=Streptomyces anandii TaxID=285454 RepID=UPI0037BAA206